MDKSTVDVEGYLLIKEFLDLNEDCLANIENILDNSDGHILFNSKRQENGKRWQVKLPSENDIFKRGSQKLSKLFPECQISEASIVVAERGCLEQQVHTDYMPGSQGNYSAIICASSEGSSLNVWPRSHLIFDDNWRDPQKKNYSTCPGRLFDFSGRPFTFWKCIQKIQC